ncbi:MAG: protein-disulfide reductase DsbD N-terminal domain-containing protein [Bacteroidota bacterium]|nr:protein-disulfide reductase DsbD N-terminal domain-containing protein [Bacteroidota bacterium]
MKHLLTLVIVLTVCAGAFAQVENPVKWSYASKKINGSESMVYLKASIQDGWHIYSLTAGGDSPLKTAFTFSPSKVYTLVGKTIEPSPVKKYEPILKMDISYFEKSVIFQQKIKLTAANVTSVKGKLEYMACNDHKCNPSEQIDFNIPIGK